MALTCAAAACVGAILVAKRRATLRRRLELTLF
jgi:hypothetical protein